MNRIKSFSYLSVRAYGSRKRRGPNPGISRTLDAVTQPDEQERLGIFDELENLDDMETDFMEVHKSHKQHERELKKMKEKLKLNITASKYIKEKQPSFLTSGEKQQIRILHEEDPIEWTPEKLSDSFPALPETIKKVLKAKWYPKTSKRVLEYDEKVADNWNKYKHGLLMLDSRLETHLSRFKDRKILMTNREELATHLIAAEPNIPKPKSQLFSNIIKSYLNIYPETNNESMAVVEKTTEIKNRRNDKINVINNPVDNETAVSNSKEQNALILMDCNIEKKVIGMKHKTKSKKNEFMTLDNYLKQEVEGMTNVSSPREITIFEAHKKNIEQANLVEDMNKCNLMATQEKENTNENVISKEFIKNDAISNSVANSDSSILDNKSNNAMEKMETHVKEWIDKTEEDGEIAGFINIPKQKFKAGMLYRVNDCYYDDDGEFLYRVPGLQN